jgi:hypothetical protein
MVHSKIRQVDNRSVRLEARPPRARHSRGCRFRGANRLADRLGRLPPQAHPDYIMGLQSSQRPLRYYSTVHFQKYPEGIILILC